MESKINIITLMFFLGLGLDTFIIVNGNKEVPQSPKWERSVESFVQEQKQKRKHEIEIKKREILKKKY